MTEKEKAKAAIDWMAKNGYERGDLDTALYIMELIKRATPKPPAWNEFGHVCCPACGYSILHDEGWRDEYAPHCETCGQAIDWEEYDEDE